MVDFLSLNRVAFCYSIYDPLVNCCVVVAGRVGEVSIAVLEGHDEVVWIWEVGEPAYGEHRQD